MKKFIEKHSHILHKVGLSLSFLCAIHCLAMPFILVALPIVGESFLAEQLELGLILSSLVLGVFILIKDYKHHFNKVPLILFGLSFLLVLIHLVLHNHTLLSFSSVIMAIAYLRNWQLHRSVCHTH
jgi:hypothetical protein